MKNRILDYFTPTSNPADSVAQLGEQAKQRATEYVEQTETYVQSNPLAGLVGAFSLGVFLGWLLKRR